FRDDITPLTATTQPIGLPRCLGISLNSSPDLHPPPVALRLFRHQRNPLCILTFLIYCFLPLSVVLPSEYFCQVRLPKRITHPLAFCPPTLSNTFTVLSFANHVLSEHGRRITTIFLQSANH
ncbi:unnamed protein product, partial [Penicillium nalgiovense]